MTSPGDVQKEVRKSQVYRRISSIGTQAAQEEKQIGFFQAWLLPGVILYGASFFCTKMAVYCLLFRLPTFEREVLGYDTH